MGGKEEEHDMEARKGGGMRVWGRCSRRFVSHNVCCCKLTMWRVPGCRPEWSILMRRSEWTAMLAGHGRGATAAVAREHYW